MLLLSISIQNDNTIQQLLVNIIIVYIILEEKYFTILNFVLRFDTINGPNK